MNLKTLLLAMCSGLKDGEHMLGDVQLEPYVSAKQKKYFTPSVSNLRAEMTRRADVLGMKSLKQANFKKEKCYEWLSKHPVEDPADIKFLREEELIFRNILADAATEDKEIKKTTKAAPWTTNNPHLRLYHCLTHDTVRVAFLERDQVMD
jgi:hypothetical protein